MEKRDSLSLKDLIDIKEWQKIQDNFSNVTEVNLRTVGPEGNLITSPSKTIRLCDELLKTSPLKNKICGICLPTFLGGRGVVDKNLIYSCEPGLYNFVAPLRMDNGRILGYIVLGPVILVMRKSQEEYERIADRLSLGAEAFRDAIAEIKVMSYHGMLSLIELIKDIGEYTINLTYKNITHDSSKVNRILDVLLDVAFEVSQADMGSVMFFDEKKENLTIRSARGIPDKIIKETKVKSGVGISGIAALEGRPFLIDDTITDIKILPHLRRPHIGSSLILPIRVEDKVMGVMNLSALKTSQVKFNTDNLNLMDRLINLATIAIH